MGRANNFKAIGQGKYLKQYQTPFREKLCQRGKGWGRTHVYIKKF